MELRDPRATYMLTRAAGLLLSQELPPCPTGEFAVGVGRLERGHSVVTGPQFLTLLNLVRMGSMFCARFGPELERLLHRERVRTRGRAQLAELAGRVPARRGSAARRNPALSRRDRLNLALIALEVSAHASTVKAAYSAGQLRLPSTLQQQLVPAVAAVGTQLERLVQTMEATDAGFPMNEARVRLKHVAKWFTTLAGIADDDGPDVLRRIQAYCKQSSDAFEGVVGAGALAREAMAWRRAYLSMNIGLGVGAHFLHGYPLDLGLLYQLYCFMELGAALTRAGRTDLLQRFVLCDGHSPGCRNYMGTVTIDSAGRFGRSGLKLPARMSLLTGAREAGPTVVRTLFGPWSVEEHLAMLGLMLETGARRGLLVVADGWAAGELLGAEEGALCPVTAGLGATSELYVARLVPTANHMMVNEDTSDRVIQHVLA